MTTAILYNPRHTAHNDPQRAERAERLTAIKQAIDESELGQELLMPASRAATEAELAAVHDPAYLRALQNPYAPDVGDWWDSYSNWYISRASWEGAIWGAGTTLAAVEAVLEGKCQNAFAVVRPPGHHASANRGAGFCLINNIAVAAQHALEHFGLARVAIVDVDVHHGNGTQDIFYREPRVLTCSLHQWPWTDGVLDEMGEQAGFGTHLNVPLPLAVGDVGYQRAFEQIVIPALQRWQPQLILVSAGYDGHWADVVGTMLLSAAGYAKIIQQLYDLAHQVCQGRLVLVLEGGYNLDSLVACVMASLRVLMAHHPIPDPLGPMSAPEPDVEGIIAQLQQRHPLMSDA
jgi:acetoin utilization deacetylase AcuC-like enzyme